ncbi:acyltransferase [Siphonobacter sp.]|uniref:acyltransferase n=1 Tax=Siphonobacter sp. TaxID=1869184 RepID=UPI003B3B14BB
MKETIGWVDRLRVLACFLVILSHCCDPFVAKFDADRESFLTGVAIGSLVRPCVPLFVMLSGVLLFPVTSSVSEFYKKRIGRILIPLVFWSLVLPILFYVYLNFINPGTMNPAIDKTDHTLPATLRKLYTFVFNFNFATIPLWYLYMLIGLYLVMPIFSVWLQQATKKDVEVVLKVWAISLVLPYVKMVAPILGYPGNYGNKGILGVCDWNDYGTFYYLSGFIGYLVLAYYLVRYPLNWTWNQTLAVGIPLFLVGYASTAGGYVLMQQSFPGNYAYLEIVWYFAGINVFLMTFPVFLFVQKAKASPSAGWSRLAYLTFGMYLCHFIFVDVMYDLLGALGSLPPVVHILGMALSVFGISYLIARLMDQFSLTRRFIR